MPSLLIDEARARTNIRAMAEKARRHGLRYRPHLKTPQRQDVARWYRDEGVSCATVSSVDMALYFEADGWNDLTLAIPVDIRDLDRIRALASRIRLHLLVDSADAALALDGIDTPVWIKIDAGYHRTGVPAADHEAVARVVEAIGPRRFAGFLTHAGHSYFCTSHSEIQALHADQLRQLNPLKAVFGGELSIGDTPTCVVADDFTGIDEVRPGNLIYFDMKMVRISACTADQVAVCMVAPVISHQPSRNQVVIHGGSVHFSKDHYDGVFGQVVRLTDTGWAEPVEGAQLTGLCQEHGTVTGPADFIASLKIGDLVGILPAHSCLTVACMKEK